MELESNQRIDRIYTDWRKDQGADLHCEPVIIPRVVVHHNAADISCNLSSAAQDYKDAIEPRPEADCEDDVQDEEQSKEGTEKGIRA